MAVTLAYVRREIVAPPLRGDAPCGWLVKVRGLALGGALVRLPGHAGQPAAGPAPAAAGNAAPGLIVDPTGRVFLPTDRSEGTPDAQLP